MLATFTESGPRIEAIIFDIDGTLADSSMLGMTASQRVLVDAGYPSITAEE